MSTQRYSVTPHLTLGNRRYTGVTAIATKPPAVDLTHDSGDPKLDKQP